MRVWQADFYRRHLRDETGKPLWELLICDSAQTFQFSALCRQSQANSNWLAAQFQQQAQTKKLPDIIQVFRPQSLSLIEAAGKVLGVKVEATRRTVIRDIPYIARWPNFLPLLITSGRATFAQQPA